MLDKNRNGADSASLPKGATNPAPSIGGKPTIVGDALSVNLSTTPAPFAHKGGTPNVIGGDPTSSSLNRTPVHGPGGNSGMSSPRTIAQSAVQKKG